MEANILTKGSVWTDSKGKTEKTSMQQSGIKKIDGFMLHELWYWLYIHRSVPVTANKHHVVQKISNNEIIEMEQYIIVI